jgi:hypothetical protein
LPQSTRAQQIKNDLSQDTLAIETISNFIIRGYLVEETLVRCQTVLLAMLKVHAPKAEAVHRLAKRVVFIEEFDRAHDIEEDLRVLAHPQRVNGARVLTNVVALVGLPSISTLCQCQESSAVHVQLLTRGSPSDRRRLCKPAPRHGGDACRVLREVQS